MTKSSLRVLVSGSGGTPSTNFVRSLKECGKRYYTIGIEPNKYYIHRSETDESHPIPYCDKKNFLEEFKKIISRFSVNFLHMQNDAEIGVVSKNRDKVPCDMFLPPKRDVETCLNKFETYKMWKKAGLPQPETMLIRSEKDLKDALGKWGKIWIRDTTGSGGRGSIALDTFDKAKSWIDFKDGWNKYTAAELLDSTRSITAIQIWKDGGLIVSQQRKRLYWEFAKIAPSGITGYTGGAVTTNDRLVDDVATRSALAINKKPHGIYSVDMTYPLNDKGEGPSPTEINIGRFFTTHYFFTKLGLNLPDIYIQSYYKNNYYKGKTYNPLPSGWVWIRGMDFLPVLVKEKSIR